MPLNSVPTIRTAAVLEEAAIPDILPTDSDELLRLKKETLENIFCLPNVHEKITTLINALTKTHPLGQLFWQARRPVKVDSRLGWLVDPVLAYMNSPSLENGTLKTLNDELVRLLKNLNLTTFPESLFNDALAVVLPTDAAFLKKHYSSQTGNSQNPFLKLNQDIFSILDSHCDLKSRRAISLTSRRLNTFFKPRLVFEGFLHHIAKREDSRIANMRNSLQVQSPANLFILLLESVKYWNQAAIDAILNLYPLSKQSPENLATLLRQSVAYGNQYLAESILKIHPHLLLEKGTFGDYARIYEDGSDNYKPRTFKNTSAFQYAVWALDRHMWQMMLKYLPGDKREEAYNQLKELETEGREHGSKYDLTPYKKALGIYANNLSYWIYNTNWEAEHKWRNIIGRIQCGLTAALAQELCRKDRSFNPTPAFKDKVLPRTLKFFNDVTRNVESLFPLPSSPPYFLGAGYAISRNNHPWKAEIALKNEDFMALPELAAITAYDQVRTQERLELMQLLAPKPSSAQHLTR